MATFHQIEINGDLMRNMVDRDAPAFVLHLILAICEKGGIDGAGESTRDDLRDWGVRYLGNTLEPAPNVAEARATRESCAEAWARLREIAKRTGDPAALSNDPYQFDDSPYPIFEGPPTREELRAARGDDEESSQ